MHTKYEFDTDPYEAVDGQTYEARYAVCLVCGASSADIDGEHTDLTAKRWALGHTVETGDTDRLWQGLAAIGVVQEVGA